MRKQNIANIYFRWGYRTDGSSLCTFRTLRNECHCIAMDSHFFRSLSFDLSNPQAKKFFVFEFVLVRFAAAIFFLDYFHANWTHSRCNSCIYLQIECTDNSMRTNFVAIIYAPRMCSFDGASQQSNDRYWMDRPNGHSIQNVSSLQLRTAFCVVEPNGRKKIIRSRT